VQSSNFLAPAALVLWPLVCLAVSAFLPLRQALAFSIVGALLLLPARVAIDLPLIGIDKTTAACFGALVVALVRAPRGLVRRVSFSGVDFCVVALFVSALATALTNPDPVMTGPLIRPGLTLHDALQMAASDLLVWVLPFMIGRRYFRSPRSLADLHAVILVGALLYLPLIAYEIRMSPQLHYIVYGFQPHKFGQQIRGEHYRAMVFIGHGLSLAFFLSMSVEAAFTLWRAQIRAASTRTDLLGWLCFAFLALSRSLGPFLFGLTSIPILASLKPRRILLASVLVSSFVLSYPALRARGVLRGETLIAAASVFPAERADSFAFRVRNEEALLKRAGERLWFGWGSWGRQMIYDPETGENTSVTDGLWILQLGQNGVLGFAAKFGLLLLPVFLAAARRRLLRSPSDAMLVAGTAWMIALQGLDLIPNVVLFPSIFVSGALCGAVEGAAATNRTGRRRRGSTSRTTQCAPLAESTMPEGGRAPESSLGSALVTRSPVPKDQPPTCMRA
jgi:hypothetical protein